MLETGVAVYGGYDPTTWRRSTELTTTITGAPEGVLLDGDKNVLLQFADGERDRQAQVRNAAASERSTAPA